MGEFSAFDKFELFVFRCFFSGCGVLRFELLTKFELFVLSRFNRCGGVLSFLQNICVWVLLQCV